mmetsp:Transcript_27636/g.49867  ORF Transcript_27636/g.49867 Transcript_27636/m.49867 type:complete len:673 (-) Transcript_27636:602-2620(-)
MADQSGKPKFSFNIDAFDFTPAFTDVAEFPSDPFEQFVYNTFFYDNNRNPTADEQRNSIAFYESRLFSFELPPYLDRHHLSSIKAAVGYYYVNTIREARYEPDLNELHAVLNDYADYFSNPPLQKAQDGPSLDNMTLEEFKKLEAERKARAAKKPKVTASFKETSTVVSQHSRAAQAEAAAQEERKVAEVKKPKKVREKPKEKAIDKEALISRMRSTVPASEESKLIEPDSTRLPVNIVFIGHVDAGKSTTCGNILLRTGKVDARLIERYEAKARENGRESWWLAYIMDQNEEEQQRGKTIEVGKAFFELTTKRFIILDAPGHKDYVPNMIAGASQADYAALVISARTGEFETGFEKSGQTREHAILAKSLGVQKLIVIINKMDSVEWSKERYDYIKNSLEPFLRDTCFFHLDTDVHFVPLSGLHGYGLDQRIPTEMCSWYNGPSFFELLDSIEPPKRMTLASLRLPILDRIKEQSGMNIFGKVESGVIVKSQEVLILPLNIKAEVTEIVGGEDTKLMYAGPGENISLKLRLPEEVEVFRGYMLTDPDNPCHVAQEFEADATFVELLEHKPLVTAGYTCVMHCHTNVEECTITEIVALIDPIRKKKIKCNYAKVGSRLIIKIRTRVPICIETFKDYPELGRFTLRDEQKTVAVGRVLKINYADEEEEVEETN